MSARPICQRCHRVRPVVGRYCATCEAELRANEQRRFTPDQAAALIAAGAANKAAAVAAPLPPPLKPGAQPRRPDLRVVQPPAPQPPPPPPPAAAAPAQLSGLPEFVLPNMEDEAG